MFKESFIEGLPEYVCRKGEVLKELSKGCNGLSLGASHDFVSQMRCGPHSTENPQKTDKMEDCCKCSECRVGHANNIGANGESWMISSRQKATQTTSAPAGHPKVEKLPARTLQVFSSPSSRKTTHHAPFFGSPRWESSDDSGLSYVAADTGKVDRFSQGKFPDTLETPLVKLAKWVTWSLFLRERKFDVEHAKAGHCCR